MRILAIRGANLASLAAPFEIDLAAPPLASAGLFAITGETGAGKSTILDALCLALYGEYPRLSVTRRETAPDPGGEAISVQDGRAILRRGAGSGYAEVDFIGQDGARYRVRWEANRARGRANGRLQAEQRVLRHLDDLSPVASGKTQVRDAIAARTDLTFEQFRRTVLLAQGEFDTFLLAAEAERAELLEKITGTEIYAAISIRVRAGADARRQQLKLLEQRRTDIGLLEEDARQALLDEQAGLDAALTRKAAERDGHAETLNHHKQIAAARSNLAQAEAQAAIALSARAAAAGDYEALAELDLVETLRPLVIELDKARRDAAAMAVHLTALLGARGEAQSLDDAAGTELAARLAADESAEDIFKRFGPLWSEAEKLDAELATARTEFDEAMGKSRQAQTTLDALLGTLAALDHAIAQTTEAHRRATAELAARARHVLLADRLDDVTALLQKRADLRRDHEAAAAARTAIGKIVEQSAADSAELSLRLASDRQRKDALTRDIADQRGRLAAIDEPALQDREADLQQLLEILRAAAEICDRHRRTAADLAQAALDLDQAAQEMSAADAEIIGAEADCVRDRRARAEIAPFADLADESVSPAALHLRSLLVPQAECPVCGSLDHPHLAHPSALNELVASLRRRRHELDKALDATGQRLDAATRARAAAEARRAEADRRRESGGRAVSEAETAYAAQRPALVALTRKTAFTAEIPPVPEGAAAPILAGLAATAQIARRAVGATLAEARGWRAAIDDLVREHEKRGIAIDQAVQTLDDRISRQHNAELQVNEQTVLGSVLAERLDSIDREIAPFLAAADRSLAELDADPAAIAAILAAAARAYDTLRRQIAGLDRDLQRSALDRAAAAAAVAHARTQQADAVGQGEQRRSAAEEKSASRAKLLGGEATASHRTRHNEARRTARDDLAAARDAKSTIEAALHAAGARYQEAISASDVAKSRVGAADDALDAGCDGIARSRDRVIALLASDPARPGTLRAQIQQLDRAMAEAAASILTRQGDLTRALDGVDATIDAAGLTEALARLQTEIADLHQRRGALSAALQRDDRARVAAATLSAEIDTAQADCVIWQAVDDAIGSATGDRFRRFVQGITLDHLVHLANDHLSALSPRYRLARHAALDLTLHVVDRDMGDEIRATRSLSGGERFLVSLALALALSGLEGRDSFVDTLFIDEGFGSLDAETLDIAVDALETLQGRGRKVGVITHVAAMIERIAVQVRVEKRGAGRSIIRISDGFDVQRR